MNLSNLPRTHSLQIGKRRPVDKSTITLTKLNQLKRRGVSMHYLTQFRLKHKGE